MNCTLTNGITKLSATATQHFAQEWKELKTAESFY